MLIRDETVNVRPLLLLGFLGVVLFLTGFFQQYSNDLWKALYSGRYLSLFHQFPHHSTFTFSPVENFQPRDAYNWLGNLFFVGYYQLLGINGLIVLRFFVLLFATGVTYSIFDEVRPLVVISLIVYAFGVKQKLLLRTALFVLPGLSLTLWCWAKSHLTGRRTYRWGIPLVLTVWSNLHGSYLVGVGLLILLVAGERLDAWLLGDGFDPRACSKSLLLVLVVLLAVVFVKPFPDYSLPNKFGGFVERSSAAVLSYESAEAPPANANVDGEEPASVSGGESLRTRLYRMVRNLTRGIVFDEQGWRSGEFAFPLRGYSYLFVAVTLAIVPITFGLFLVNLRRIRFVHLLPVLGAFVLSLGYIRTVAYLPMVAVPVAFWKARLGDFEGVELGPIVMFAVGVAIAALATSMTVHAATGNIGRFFGVEQNRLRFGTDVRFSQRLPDYVLREFPEERILVHYNVSSYVLWRWWPRKKVFIDTKGSAYEDDFFDAYGRNSPGDLAERHGLDYLMVPMGTPRNIHRLIPGEDWAPVAFDEGMIFYERVETPRYVDPLDAILLGAGDFRRLPDYVKPGFRSMITYLYRFQNIARRNSASAGKEGTMNGTDR